MNILSLYEMKHFIYVILSVFSVTVLCQPCICSLFIFSLLLSLILLFCSVLNLIVYGKGLLAFYIICRKKVCVAYFCPFCYKVRHIKKTYVFIIIRLMHYVYLMFLLFCIIYTLDGYIVLIWDEILYMVLLYCVDLIYVLLLFFLGCWCLSHMSKVSLYLNLYLLRLKKKHFYSFYVKQKSHAVIHGLFCFILVGCSLLYWCNNRLGVDFARKAYNTFLLLFQHLLEYF